MTTCASPEKQRYPSRAAARRAIRELYRQRRDQGGRLVTYECAGGHWHVGHNNTLATKARKRRRRTLLGSRR